MREGPPAANPNPGAGPSGEPDPAEFARFYDHYLPRVLGFARRRKASGDAAEQLTEAILAEVLRREGPLMPGPVADEAVVGAALRVAGPAATAA